MVSEAPCFTGNYYCIDMQCNAEVSTGAACGVSTQSAYQPMAMLTGRTCPFN
jgi:hypothetical protein